MTALPFTPRKKDLTTAYTHLNLEPFHADFALLIILIEITITTNSTKKNSMQLNLDMS